MPTTRSYTDACGIARALDVVGERWALLIVRELLLGPRRFVDLRRALPRASSNLVADRLRELTGHGVIRPRGGPRAYELTEWGRELEPVVLALGAWGLRVPLPDEPSLSPVSVLLFLRGTVRPTEEATFGFELDGTEWTIRTEVGTVRITPGWPRTATATLRGEASALNGVLENSDDLARVTIDGDRAALRRLLSSAGTPTGPTAAGPTAGSTTPT